MLSCKFRYLKETALSAASWRFQQKDGVGAVDECTHSFELRLATYKESVVIKEGAAFD